MPQSSRSMSGSVSHLFISIRVMTTSLQSPESTPRILQDEHRSLIEHLAYPPNSRWPINENWSSFYLFVDVMPSGGAVEGSARAYTPVASCICDNYHPGRLFLSSLFWTDSTGVKHVGSSGGPAG